MSDRDPQDPAYPEPVARDPVTPDVPPTPVDRTPTVPDAESPYVAGSQPQEPYRADAADTKPDLGKRAIAAIIDGAIAGAVGLIPVIGGIIGALYILLRDGFEFEFMNGRSVGKTLMKLRPVRLDGGKMDLATSARRNWTVALGSLATFLLIVPILGWLLYIPVLIAAVVIGIVEIVSVVNAPDGRRWGDKLAGTKVIEVAE